MGRDVFVYLPSPYEDELLYSVVARYCAQANQRVHKLSCILFEKCFLIFRADLPGSLATVAARTKYCWGISAETIQRTMTIFPYYEPFLPNFTREDRKRGLLLGQRRCIIGTRAYRVVPPTFLRLCTKCTESDREEFGETYWRRTHQLPGVLVCPDHAAPLTSTSARIQPRRTECVTASSVASRHPESIDHDNMEVAQSIAHRCRDILKGKKLIWGDDFSGNVYREAALERGIRKIPGTFSPKMFIDEFFEYYGSHLLSKLGINGEKDKATWIYNLFQNNSKQVFHPLEHILIQLFLESLPNIISSGYSFGCGPWMCPNPYGTHTETYPIKKLVIRSRPDKTFYGRAQCSCGFTFTTCRLNNENPEMPVVEKISSFGPTRYNYARTCLRLGKTLEEIANELRLTPSHLQSILQRGSKLTVVPSTKILQARKMWLILLNEDPERRVTVARKKSYGTYQFLRKHDREWIDNQKEPRKLTVDWQKRDAEWSQRISKAGERLGGGKAKTVVVKESGLNLRIFTQLDRLPLCSEAIRQYADSNKIPDI